MLDFRLHPAHTPYIMGVETWLVPYIFELFKIRRLHNEFRHMVSGMVFIAKNWHKSPPLANWAGLLNPLCEFWLH